MTIKVIDETPDASVVKRVICRNCGVTLEYTPYDRYDYTTTDYTGDSDTYKSIDCPRCTTRITVG